MIYISNIIKLIKNNYKYCEPSKKKVSQLEISFASKLIKQIDQFAKKNNGNRPSIQLYNDFKNSNLNQAQFIKKKKISRQLLRSSIIKFEKQNDTLNAKYKQVQKEVVNEFKSL